MTPDAYRRGYYPKLYGALRHWIATEFPFPKAYYSNAEIPPPDRERKDGTSTST